MALSIVSHRSADELRARQMRIERKARRQEADDAIDRFQSAILEADAAANPMYAASCRIGRARTHLIAVIEKPDRAERPAA